MRVEEVAYVSLCLFFLMGTLLLVVAGYILVGCRTTRLTGRYVMQLQSRAFTIRMQTQMNSGYMTIADGFVLLTI